MLKCRLEEESLTIFCCHGGPPCVYTEYGRQLDLYLGIDSYENILQRSLTIVDPLAGELTWNDPALIGLNPQALFTNPRNDG